MKQSEASTLNFREFYSEDLFEVIKQDIGYEGEWSVAYGMHPAVLEYSGISTLDGYLGLYSQEYKEQFRKIIAPALDTSEEFKTYYDDWGARAYIFSGTGENTYGPMRNLNLHNNTLSINTEAFKELKGKYIFSRVDISNQESLGLHLKGTYTNNVYTIYVYEVQ